MIVRYVFTAIVLVLGFGIGRISVDRQQIIDAFHNIFYESHETTWDHTYWMGVQTKKNPLDTWVFQEIIYETRPDVIVEAGTYKGGSALFFANLFDLLGHGEVITIDIEDYADRHRHPRVKFLHGSSSDQQIISQVRAAIPAGSKVMVVLDSDHRKAHVLAELRAYSPLVTSGCYLVVEDTNINGHPVFPSFGPGPMEAVEEFLRNSPAFSVDHSREKYLVTHNPSGYLKRVQ